MFRALASTPNNVAVFFARLALGLSLLPHGLSKIGVLSHTPEDGIHFAFNQFGTAIDQTVTSFQNAFGLDPWMAYAAIAVEVLGSIAMILGFMGRVAALGIGITMGVAAYKTLEALAAGGAIGAQQVLTWWADSPSIGTTYGSYHLLAIGLAVAILIRGSGALSIDRALGRPTVE